MWGIDYRKQGIVSFGLRVQASVFRISGLGFRGSHVFEIRTLSPPPVNLIVCAVNVQPSIAEP